MLYYIGISWDRILSNLIIITKIHSAYTDSIAGTLPSWDRPMVIFIPVSDFWWKTPPAGTIAAGARSTVSQLNGSRGPGRRKYHTRTISLNKTKFKSYKNYSEICVNPILKPRGQRSERVKCAPSITRRVITLSLHYAVTQWRAWLHSRYFCLQLINSRIKGQVV